MRVVILSLSTKNNNTFVVNSEEGELTLHCADLKEWDKLYNYLSKPLNVEVVNKVSKKEAYVTIKEK